MWLVVWSKRLYSFVNCMEQKILSLVSGKTMKDGSRDGRSCYHTLCRKAVTKQQPTHQQLKQVTEKWAEEARSSGILGIHHFQRLKVKHTLMTTDKLNSWELGVKYSPTTPSINNAATTSDQPESVVDGILHAFVLWPWNKLSHQYHHHVSNRQNSNSATSISNLQHPNINPWSN